MEQKIDQFEQLPLLPPNNFRRKVILSIAIAVAIVLAGGLIYWIRQKPSAHLPVSNPPPGGTNPPSMTITAPTWSTWSQFGYDPQSSGQAPFRGPQTNKLKWFFRIGATNCNYQTIVTAPVLDKDGNLYFGTSEGSVISLDSAMKTRWEYELSDAYARNNCNEQSNVAGGISDHNIEYAPALSNSGYIIFGTSGINNAKKIYALDLAGQLKWTYPIDGPLQSAIKIGSNNKIYFTTPTTIHTLEENGQNVNTFSLTVKSNTPAIAKDGTVYVCASNGLVALTPDLKLKWIFSGVKNLRTCSPAVDPKSGVVYFPYKNQEANEYKLYAVNPDGSLKWASNIFWSESAPVVASDGTIYISTTDLSIDPKTTTYQTRGNGELFAINPDGSKKWSYNIKPVLTCKKGQDKDCLTADRWHSGTAIDGSPTVGSDGIIYFGCDAQTYFALNQDGSVKWTYQGGDEWDNRAVVSPNGTLYVGPRGLIHGGLYAFNDSGTNSLPSDDEPRQNSSSEPGGR